MARPGSSPTVMHVARSSIVETLTAVCDAVLMDSNNLSQAEVRNIRPEETSETMTRS